MKKVVILSIENATHDVVHLKTEKPEGLLFTPGQAVDVALTKNSWKKKLRPFTFTSLPADDYLGFHIKTYPQHHGVTGQIGKLTKGNSLMIAEVFGAIQYKKEGIFIAGGAGITPFISIFKKLEKEKKIGGNKLIFANKTYKDIIEPDFFEGLLGENFINVLSEEKRDDMEHGHVTKDLIKSKMEAKETCFYLCGPPPMMDAVLKQLQEIGVEDSQIIMEEF